MLDITIIITYFNRKQQLLNTLKSMESTHFRNFEVIIIDDASEESQRLENSIGNFNFRIDLIRVKPEEKKWIEPLGLINNTIKESANERLIFQCAECFHVGDLISYAAFNIRDSVHLTFACQRAVPGGVFWDVHSVYKPVAYPFCTAFLKKDFVGFDESFSHGFTCSDDDLLDRTKLHSRIVIVDNPYVIHQPHYNVWATYPDYQQCYMDDFIDGLILLLDHKNTGYEAFCIGTEEYRSMEEAAQICINTLAKATT